MQASEIKNLRSPRLLSLFAWYLQGYLKKHFNAVRISYSEALEIQDRPGIIYTNHPSWWDPLLFIFLDKCLFAQRVSFGPMDQSALANYSFMRRLGIFGITSDSFTGLRSFITVSSELLHDSDTLLWITAQGQFSDSRVRPINLQPGIAHLVKHNPDVFLIPAAFEFPFWFERHPEALIRTGSIIDAKTLLNKSCLEVTQLLEQQLTNTMDELAELAKFRKPEEFQELLSGEVGAGVIYNRFSQFIAKILGRDFHSKHSEINRDGKSVNH